MVVCGERNIRPCVCVLAARVRGMGARYVVKGEGETESRTFSTHQCPSSPLPLSYYNHIFPIFVLLKNRGMEGGGGFHSISDLVTLLSWLLNTYKYWVFLRGRVVASPFLTLI